MPRQSRSAGEGAGRRFKRRRRRRGRRGAVSKVRGRDKMAEGKERQKRDRSERPGDRKFERSRKRRPKRRQRRLGGERDFGRDRPQTGLPRDRERKGPQRQGLEEMRARINEIRARRQDFSTQLPEQVAERRGFDPDRLRQIPGGQFDGQPSVRQQPVAPQHQQQQPGVPPVAPQQQPAVPQFHPDQGVQIGPDGQVIQPVPTVGEPEQVVPDLGYTPIDQPGPTAPPGVATDAYGKPVGSGPYNPGPVAPQQFPVQDQRAGYMWSGRGQVNPRAAGMQRFAQAPQPPKPEEQYQ